MVSAKIFHYLFVHQKDNPHKPLAKLKRTRKEMLKALENRKKIVVDFPRNAFKRKNRVEEGGVLG